jgi:hypothetical protein
MFHCCQLRALTVAIELASGKSSTAVAKAIRRETIVLYKSCFRLVSPHTQGLEWYFPSDWALVPRIAIRVRHLKRAATSPLGTDLVS